jgi:sugar/nucleoside kinase (ribokinase family)
VGLQIYLHDFIQPDDPIPSGAFWQSSTDWIGERGKTAVNLKIAGEKSHRHDCTVVITDGENPFVVAHSGVAEAFNVFRVDSVRDTTGAGDVFRAGMLHGLNEGWNLKASLQFASAAGALNVRTLGANADIPSVREIESLIASQPEISAQFSA